MTRRSFAVLLVVAAAAFAAGCSKDWCESKYGLVEPSPLPAPGPKIIVRKDAAAGTLQWYVDSGSGEVLQTAGPSAFADGGSIRSDFVGTKIMDFTAKMGSTGYSPANYVVFQTQVGGDTYMVEIVRTAGDKVRWYVTKGGSRKLIPTGGVTTGQVPLELTGTLVPNSFHEQIEDVDLDSIDFFRTAN